MSISFRVSHNVSAPPSAVFEALTDLQGVGKWMPGFVGIESLDSSPTLGVGSRFRETRRLFGQNATEEFEVTALDPPRRVDLRVDGAKGSSKRGEYRFSYDLQPDDRGTKVVLTGEIRGLSGAAAVFSRLFVGMYRSACAKDVRAMGDYVEKRTTHA